MGAEELRRFEVVDLFLEVFHKLETQLPSLVAGQQSSNVNHVA